MDILNAWIVLLVVSTSIVSSRLPPDIQPINLLADSGNHYVTKIAGVHSIVQVKDDFYVTSMDRVYSLEIILGNTGSVRHKLLEVIKWPSTASTRELCMQKTRVDDVCNNFIRIFEPKSLTANEFIVCGTNSFQPSCRNYVAKNGSFTRKSHHDFSGTSICPYDPKHTGASLYTDGSMYAGTVADFLGRKPIIYRNAVDSSNINLERTKRESTWLSDPWFVRLVDSGGKVLIFFTENAVEDDSGPTYSRVAQLCKNDQGGEHILRRQFTTFQKARLNCSYAGLPPFYFNELSAITDFVEIPGTNGMKVLFATINTPENSIWGSAVCAYLLRDIENTFDKPFLEQHISPEGMIYWSETQGRESIYNALNKCEGDEENGGIRNLSDEDLEFIRTHPLKSHSVPNWSFGNVLNSPLFMQLNAEYRFSSITVESGAGSTASYVVILIGTSDGRILKVVPNFSRSAISYNTSIHFVSESKVFDKTKCNGGNEDRRVINIKVDKTTGFILVSFVSCVISVPMCPISSSCQRDCISARDPFCAWNGVKCVTVLKPQGLHQDIEYGDASGLPACGPVKPPISPIKNPISEEKDSDGDIDGEDGNTLTDATSGYDLLSRTTASSSNGTVLAVAGMPSSLLPGFVGFGVGVIAMLVVAIVYYRCKKAKPVTESPKKRNKIVVSKPKSPEKPKKPKDKRSKMSKKDSNRKNSTRSNNSHTKSESTTRSDHLQNESDVGENMAEKKNGTKEKKRPRKSETSTGSAQEISEKTQFLRQTSRESQSEASMSNEQEIPIRDPKYGPIPTQYAYSAPPGDPLFHLAFNMDTAGSATMQTNPSRRNARMLQRNLSLQMPKNTGNLDPQFFQNTTPVTFRRQNPMEMYGQPRNMVGSPTVTTSIWQPGFVKNASPVKPLQEVSRPFQTTSLDRKSTNKGKSRSFALAHSSDVQKQGRNFSDRYPAHTKDDGQGIQRKRYLSETSSRPPPLHTLRQLAYSSIEEEILPLNEQGSTSDIPDKTATMNMQRRPNHLPIMRNENEISIPYSNPGSPMTEHPPYLTQPQQLVSGFTLPAPLYRQSSEISPTKFNQKHHPFLKAQQSLNLHEQREAYPYFVQSPSGYGRTMPQNPYEEKQSKSNPATPDVLPSPNLFFTTTGNSSENIRNRNPSGKSQGNPSVPVARVPEYEHPLSVPKITEQGTMKTMTPAKTPPTPATQSYTQVISGPKEKNQSQC